MKLYRKAERQGLKKKKKSSAPDDLNVEQRNIWGIQGT